MSTSINIHPRRSDKHVDNGHFHVLVRVHSRLGNPWYSVDIKMAEKDGSGSDHSVTFFPQCSEQEIREMFPLAVWEKGSNS